MKSTRRSIIRECALELILRLRVRDAGGKTIKLSSARGLPDRLVILPGRLFICELKRGRRGRLTPHQIKWLRDLETLGVACCVIRDVSDIDEALK